MKFLIRILGVTAVILLTLLVTSVLGQRWLSQQQEAVGAELMESKRARFHSVARLARLGPAPWDERTTALVLNALTADRMHVLPQPPDAGARHQARLFVDISHRPDAAAAQTLRFEFTPPKGVRLLVLHQRLGLILGLLALTLGILLATVLWIRGRGLWTGDETTRSRATADLGSLASLAKVSVEQGMQLEQERNERLRIQEDLNFQQVLLNRALEEKIRLGHDLHDGIIQSLYATGLTLEAAKKLLATPTGPAGEQLEAALDMLNRTIRDVRSYILGLAPENIRVQSFSEAVKSIADTLGAGASVGFDLQIDETAAAQLSEKQYADLVQIVREGVSNSIRHGKASRIGIELAQSDGQVCLVVEDNGIGFAMDQTVRGHGLDNMEARAERLRAQARCTSRPGSGTRIVITFSANT